MIDEIEQCKKDISYESKDLDNVDFSKLDKGWQYWDIGDKISWAYKEDLEFRIKYCDVEDEKDFEIWMRHGNGPYTGVLFTFPEQKFRIDENAIVCCYDWPIQKDNPDVFWISLNRLLISPDLYKVYKI